MIYADLHIHIGQSLNGKAVKITASKTLTLPNIIQTARDVKGLNLIGLVDAQSTGVRQDLKRMVSEGELRPLSGGGYAAKDLIILTGTEVEIKIGEGHAHFLAFFPTVEKLENYITVVKNTVKNWQLSSQKASIQAEDWLDAVINTGEGIWLPAHAFTPHKGIYGNCCRRLADVLPIKPKALEIGLSADRAMAMSISELEGLQLFSNSDAHSLPKIAREYNCFELTDPSFHGLQNLIEGRGGNMIRNYGLPPRVGKYHRTYCLVCEQVIDSPPPQLKCSRCGSEHVVTGVLDRLMSIADRKIDSEQGNYIYQVSLAQLPGIGPKMYKKLLAAFHTEMAVLHEVSFEDLAGIAGENIAQWIIRARDGNLTFEAGGGGIFGRVVDILSPSQE